MDRPSPRVSSSRPLPSSTNSIIRKAREDAGKRVLSHHEQQEKMLAATAASLMHSVACDEKAKELLESPTLNFLSDGSLNPDRKRCVRV